MFVTKRFIAASVLSLLLSGAAQAALTAEQVWAGWQANAAFADMNLVAENTQKQGSVLTLSNITIRPTIGSGTEAVGTIAQIAMTEKPDGSVAIALSPEFSVTMSEGATGGSLTISHQNLDLTARQDNGTTAYDFSGQSLTVAGNFNDMVAMLDKSGTKPSSTDFDYTFVNPRGTYSDTPGANRTFRLDLLSDGADFRMDQVNPMIGQNIQQTGRSDSLNFAFEVSMPATFDIATVMEPSDFGAAIEDGFSFKMTGAQGMSTQSISDSSDVLTYSADVTSAPSTFAILMDRNGFDVNVAAAGFTATVTSPELPMPKIEMTADNLATAIRMPIVSDQAQDFRYMVLLGNLVVSEEAWALFDPTKTLPRDPATLSLDVKGKVLFDLFAMMKADEDGSTPPEPRFDSVDLTDFRVAAAGASMTGTGAFTIDNAAPVPVPSGTSEFTVTGANDLINSLITIGLLTQEDATGARMAMAMLMEPGTGDDVLISKIEARPDGSIYVNGQQMK